MDSHKSSDAMFLLSTFIRIVTWITKSALLYKPYGRVERVLTLKKYLRGLWTVYAFTNTKENKICERKNFKHQNFKKYSFNFEDIHWNILYVSNLSVGLQCIFHSENYIYINSILCRKRWLNLNFVRKSRDRITFLFFYLVVILWSFDDNYKPRNLKWKIFLVSIILTYEDV